MRSLLTFEKLVTDFQFNSVLDVGAGDGKFSNMFKERGKKVYTTDILESDYQGDFNTIDFDRNFDCVWCAHTLEHQLNVHHFLSKIFHLIDTNGVLAISVPPLKHNIVGGHVTLWNGGLLLYNLILAGFDCSEASVKQYGYDISVIVKKKEVDLPILNYDYGDIEMLAEYFPMKVKQGFNGQLDEINW